MCPGEESIAAYVAGALPPVERDGVDAHLDACPSCQELVATLAHVHPTGAPRASHSTLGAPSTPALDDDPTSVAGGQLGRYVLLERLGAGGMGVVYAAYDPELDRKVAVKVLRRHEAGAQLREEARAIARLAHPHVIAIHDVGESDGEVFIAMEHVDGETVRAWLRQPRTPSAILDVFVQAGRGLAAAHAVGLVHRDVKPSNIIVGRDGRARVLDFGLARPDGEGAVAGTLTYMAPEQRRGERVDARADQYAFAVSLWEALAGSRDAERLEGVSERVSRALRRARAERPDDRFPTLDGLLAELAPAPSRTLGWAIATAVAAVAALASVGFVLTRGDAPPLCDRAGAPFDAVWNPVQDVRLRAAFAATGVPYAAVAASSTVAQLDAYADRWRGQAVASCRATQIDRVQPAASHALRTGCLDELLARTRPVVAAAVTADRAVVANAGALVEQLPDPVRCADVDALAAMPALPPAERDRAEVEALRSELAALDVALLTGDARKVEARVTAAHERARTLGYLPLVARAELTRSRLRLGLGDHAGSVTAKHAAAQAATGARDLATLAEVWIELSQALGNDLRTSTEARLFDGYAQALVAQLPDRAALEAKLAWARCNYNVPRDEAGTVADHCRDAIARADQVRPRRPGIAAAARVRLGHFLRLQGKLDESFATLHEAVTQTTQVYGRLHPDVALAHYALGIAEISRDAVDAGIAELREALAIREAVYPSPSLQIAESLIGLGDAYGTAGRHAEAVTHLERAIAMLDASGDGTTMHALNARILVGMSLEELARQDDALAHYLRGADLGERYLPSNGGQTAMALRLAASVEANRRAPAAAVPHLERAVRILERGKAPALELAQTQYALAEMLLKTGDRERARSVAATARVSFASAGAAGAKGIEAVDALVR